MPKILVVDDEPDILLMLRMALEDEGYDVVLAADGEMAMSRIEEHSPDLVVLDLMMPVLDGYGVLGRLQSQGSTLPVVVLSARSDQSDIDRALALGAAEFMSKPFDLDRLLALVAAKLDGE